MQEEWEANQSEKDFEELVYAEDQVIYRDSNFWQFYHKMSEEVYRENYVKKGVANKYHSSSFLNDFLKKYVAYLPLSSSFVLAERDQLKRSNNGRIEAYFSILKNKLRSKRRELGRYCVF